MGVVEKADELASEYLNYKVKTGPALLTLAGLCSFSTWYTSGNALIGFQMASLYAVLDFLLWNLFRDKNLVEDLMARAQGA